MWKCVYGKVKKGFWFVVICLYFCISGKFLYLEVTRGGWWDDMINLFMFLFIICVFSVTPLGSFFMFYVDIFESFGFGLSFFLEELGFGVVLLIVVSSVYFFGYYYMFGDRGYNIFMGWLLIFVISILFLIFHEGFLLMLLGWDGLGVSSYILVGYYINWRSLNGAIVTVITNRLGDVCLFWFGVFILLSERKVFLMWGGSLLLIFLIFGAFTKSAQAPFSSWLPLAIRAPTPVRALVHSSTLVTAGVYLLLKYRGLMRVGILRIVLFSFGILTVLIAGAVSLVEQDGKKIIALSTLSQLGFIISGLGLGVVGLTYFHILSHAFLKSCMFIQVGLYIHGFFSLQDFRGYSSSYFGRLSRCVILLVCLMSLCGLVFRRGFVRKEALLRGCLSVTVCWCILFFLGVGLILTFLYSFRLGLGIFSFRGRGVLRGEVSSVVFFSSFFLVIFSVIFGWWFRNNFIILRVGFLSFDKILPFFILGLSFIIFLFSLLFLLKFFSGIFFQDIMYKYSLVILRGGFVSLESVVDLGLRSFIKSLLKRGKLFMINFYSFGYVYVYSLFILILLFII